MNHGKPVIEPADAAMRSGLSRREVLRRSSALGLSAAAVAMLKLGAARSALTQEAGGGQVIIGSSQEALNYNPLLYANTGIETAPEFLMFDSLTKLSPQGALIPNLAAQVPTVENGGISEDGLTWTYTLRDDAKWHDGQPFTSRDVEFTWQTVMNPDVAVRSRLGHEQVESLETPDEYTVVIKLKEQYAPFALVWTGGVTSVVPHHILSKEPDINIAPFNTRAPIGTGPFMFVEHVGGDHLTVERYPEYHNGPAQLERVLIKVVPEVSNLFTQISTGEIDVVDYQGIVAARWEEAQALPDVETVISPSSFVEFIYFNNGKPIFEETAVKQALYHAIDKETIINTIYYGLETPTDTYLSPDHWAYNPDVKTYPYDLDKANAILDVAGWVRGDDGIREKGGMRLAFTNSTTTGNVLRESTQLILQQAFREIGAAMEISNMPASVVWGEYTIMSQFDTLLVAWDNPIPSDPDPTSRLHSDFIPAQGESGANYVQFENAQADALMEAGSAEVDREQRTEIYRELQALLSEELPWAPIFNNVGKFAYKSALNGYQSNQYLSSNLWNVAEWSWAE